MIAQQVAVRFPERTISLVSMMSSTGNRKLPPPSSAVHKLFLGKPPDRASTVDYYVRFFGVLAGPGFPEDREALRARIERSVARSYHPAGSARQLLAVLAAGDRSAQLARIRVPTLVLHGDHDPLVRLACGEDTAKKIPGARLKVIAGMGHDLAAWRVLADEIVAHARAVPQ
jgi:proline iminopeptidase